MLYTLFILVVFYIKSDSGGGDDFPFEPADALQGQDFVHVVTKFVVLCPIG